jgi:hypothetical protein
MNGDAFSDLVLASVCTWLAARLRHQRIGVSVALGLIGIAALLGVLRYAGLRPSLARIDLPACGRPAALFHCWPLVCDFQITP